MFFCRCGLVFLGLTAFLVGLAHGKPWTPSTYPNPNIDTDRCGRHGVKSWVCDPDGVISYDSANMVEGIIKKIYSGEKPYELGSCGSDGMQGYQVAVALMQEFVKEPGMDAAQTAEHFAKQLHAAWGVGLVACNNGVLVLLSISNRQIFISTGTGVVKQLSDDTLDDIIEDVSPTLKRQRFGDAMERAMVDIGLALSGKDFEPESEDDDKHAVEEEGWFGFGLFMSFIGLISGYSWWDGRKKRMRYQDCKSKLEKLKRDQATVQAGHMYQATSCPVCLEDFTGLPAQGDGSAPSATPLDVEEDGERSALLRPLTTPASPTSPAPGAAPAAATAGAAAAADSGAPAVERRPLVLPCGHAFCEPCISRWLETKKVTCPICRKPMDEEFTPEEPDARDALPRPVRPTTTTRPETHTSDRHDTLDHDHHDHGAGPSTSSQPPRPPCTADDAPLHSDERAYEANGAEAVLPRLRLRGRRQRVGLSDDLVLAEMLFRLRRLHYQHPQYVTEAMVNDLTHDIQTGQPLSTEAIRNFQLLDPATRQATVRSGGMGATSSFGGGGGGGGGGRGGSW